MPIARTSRRRFLQQSAALVGGGFAPYFFTAGSAAADAPRANNDRLRIGCIGMRYQGSVIAEKAKAYGDIVAICDVDQQIAAKANQELAGGKAKLYEDYRAMLDRRDLDFVTIGTPDHWHTAMVIDACKAGVDVYCEKPLTLTVDEGKLLTKVVKDTGRVVQVGSWQRSDENFRLACEMVQQGRIGTLQKIFVVLGKNEQGGPFKPQTPPPYLNWNLWQGQTPDTPYIAERCHYTFRWWYEYSGGQMTDWGAHHVDIAQWGAGMQDSGPVEIQTKAKLPNVANGYNVAIDFEATLKYANGVELHIADTGRNGVLFEGTQGRIFVNRGGLAGAPVDALKDHPLPRENFELYDNDNLARPPRSGKFDAIVNHMGNFYDCLQSRKMPISNVFNQHRSVSVCHIANISMRLGRRLNWDPAREQFVGDDEANGWLRREQRRGFEIRG